jgi:hypothetical protein
MSKKAKPKIPYADTRISPEKTKAEITELLKAYGIEDVQLTSYKGEESLRFMKEVELRGVRRTLAFEVRPPNIRAKKRTWNMKEGRYEKVNVPMWAQAWRLVYWWLESKLKAIEWGLVSLEREMLAQVLIPIKDDRGVVVDEKTLAEIVEQRIAEDTLAKLPSPEDAGKKIVEAEVVTREEGD